jgi:hypothetical protein
MRSKLAWALAAYVLLALITAFSIGGTPRIAVWILLGGLALKTLIANRAGW